MAEVTTSECAFMLHQAGLEVTEAQANDLHRDYSLVRPMAERVRRPRDREAEPAHLFTFERRRGR